MTLELLIAASIFFVVSHVVLATIPVKSALVRVLGEKGFMGIFSLAALASFIAMLVLYIKFDARGPRLWENTPWLHAVILVLMLCAVLFYALSFANPSPIGMAPGVKPEARGILRVTAHPQNMGFICFGIAHALSAGTPGGIFLYGSFAALGLTGAFHQSYKKSKEDNPAIVAFLKETSVIPFMAIIRGKNRLAVDEFRMLYVFIGLVVYGVALMLHRLLLPAGN